ncbi:unnamed protein product [Cylicostephanus goldi]|uniref:Uncharacterized protein n=1 Tax=Cylicostephanus goldi TaxID=71465 RepID=A0A3P6S228_CYLGO|nr:unnamed protein product [Cylicostephanus goldi]
MEEAFESYIKECKKTKALLLEWCDGRLKVERELLELAHQFDEWEMEAITIAIGSLAATGSDAAEGYRFFLMLKWITKPTIAYP